MTLITWGGEYCKGSFTLSTPPSKGVNRGALLTTSQSEIIRQIDYLPLHSIVRQYSSYSGGSECTYSRTPEEKA